MKNLSAVCFMSDVLMNTKVPWNTAEMNKLKERCYQYWKKVKLATLSCQFLV